MIASSLGLSRRPWEEEEPLSRLSPLSIFGTGGAVRLWHDRSRGVLRDTPPYVATWSDQSGYGNHASQVLELSRPQETATGIDFDGLLSYMVVADSPSLDATTSLIVAAACTPDVVTGNHSLISKSATGVGEWSVQTNGSAVRFFVGTPGLAWSEGGTLVAGTATRLIWSFRGAGTGNAGRLRQWQDGTLLSPSFVNTIPDTITPSVNPVTFGAFSNPLQFWDGRIRALVMVVVPDHTDAEIAALDSYLRDA